MKRPFIFIGKILVGYFVLGIGVLPEACLAQIDSTGLYRISKDTSQLAMNTDAVYNRPFLKYGKAPVAIGGYLEANTHFEQTDGVHEGLSFQMRRLTLFMSSSLHRRIRFLTELEFEEGTKEINIEFAALDFEFHPLFNFRGGVVMNPIGAFNQNHDGPKWEFVERPISATQLLPATWSNVGFGFHGKWYEHDWVFAYEGYLTNGFDDRIIANEENKTFLPASKANINRFEESANGKPLFTGKLAVKHRAIGELGLSYMGGVYNSFQKDGVPVGEKNKVHVTAIDFNTLLPFQTFITGEWVWISLDVPRNYTQQFGDKQFGGYLDVVHPIVKGKVFDFEHTVLNVAIRLEYTDWNVGVFNETGNLIGDQIWSVTPGISWRPTGQTVIRLNYRFHTYEDILKNPKSKTAAVQFGVSSYF